MRALLLLVALTVFAPRPSAAQEFQLPLDCAASACIVQNYADTDPQAGVAQDPMCGPLTYDGHDGLDFRVPGAMARRGAAVLAPGAGLIAAVRDGEPERAFLTGGMAAIANKECGNGVRIDHEGGWSSQLCHMRAGSMRVRQGERVSAGQALGLVGLSGHTEFPHVHLTLRLNEEKRDPLTGEAIGAHACGAGAATPGAIWSSAARTALAYRGAQWFEMGFTGQAPAQGVSADDLPEGATRTGAALVFWALAAGPRNADVLHVRLYGPSGALIAEGARTQARDQAQAWLFAGSRTPAGGWPAGRYRGEATLERGGRVLATRSATLDLR